MPAEAETQMLLVSAVIPTRNRPTLVCRAAQSALNQTYAAMEVIVVIDGPDPATEEALSSIQDSRLRVVSLQESVGGSEARNVGAREARGKWVALLDDDDEWLPTKIEKQVCVAESTKNNKCIIATQYYILLDEKLDQIWPTRMPKPHEPLSEFLFSFRAGCQTSTLLVSRELMLHVPFTRGLKKHQDWDWLLRLAQDPDFKLLIVEEPLSKYTIWTRAGGSISQNLDWRFSASWADSRLNLMTRRAYSMLLVRTCMPTARKQGASWRERLELLRKCCVVGRPTLLLIVEAIAPVSIPEATPLWARKSILYRAARSAYRRIFAGS